MSRIDWVCTAASRPDCWPQSPTGASSAADRTAAYRAAASGRARPRGLLLACARSRRRSAESRRPPRRKRRMFVAEADDAVAVVVTEPANSTVRVSFRQGGRHPSDRACRRVRPALRTPPPPRRGSPGDRGTPDRLVISFGEVETATGAAAPPSPRSRTNRRPASPSSAHRRNSSKDPWTQPSRPWRSCAGTNLT